MRKIGFIDHFIDEWHANNYPTMIRKSPYPEQFDVTLAWAEIDPPGKLPLSEWCKGHGVTPAQSLEQVVEECDCLVVLSPDNPERHEALAELPLRSGKPVYFEKPVAATLAEARRLFEKAAAYHTPIMSSSALRFGSALANALREAVAEEPVRFVATRGAGRFGVSAIHQIEMLVMALGTGASQVMQVGTAEANLMVVNYRDGRRGTINLIPGHPFQFSAQYGEERALVIDHMEDFNLRLVDAMLAFFATGESPIPVAETLEVAALTEAGLAALKMPFTWVNVPRGRTLRPAAPVPDATPAPAEPLIALSLFQYDGEYESLDIPGGVQCTPVQGGLFTVQPDGSGLREIINLRARDNNPRFSPDGRWLYFQSNASGVNQVFRCREDGSQPGNLTVRLGMAKEYYGFTPSPDGSTLAVTAHDGQIARVLLMNSDGGAPRFATPDGAHCYMAAFSPDGRALVYANVDAGYTLELLDLQSGRATPLPTGTGCTVPQFTPDGGTLLYLKPDEEDLYALALGEGQPRKLTDGDICSHFRLSAKDEHGSSDAPAVSPDGRRIAFIGLTMEGVPQVFTMNLDRSDRRQLTRRPTPCGRVKWSPDGARLTFVSWVGDYVQLFIMDADGGNLRQITNLPGAVYLYDWKPIRP
ncbi:MAG: Gfo/Idh/MocA family oxidoreductase [Armatimonadota bacterium]